MSRVCVDFSAADKGVSGRLWETSIDLMPEQSDHSRTTDEALICMTEARQMNVRATLDYLRGWTESAKSRWGILLCRERSG